MILNQNKKGNERLAYVFMKIYFLCAQARNKGSNKFVSKTKFF